MQIIDKFYSKKYLVPLLVAVLVLFIYSLWERSPDIDDAWLGEYAYWLEKLGYVRSELLRGFTGQETKFIVHHKLVSLHGAAFIKLFGFSLYSLKAVSLFYLLVFILLFYAYTCRWKKIFVTEDLYFSLIILFSFTFVFKYSFIFRPEIMVMCIGFAGFILLEKYIENNNSNLWPVFFSGVLFGLTVFAHLNSLVLIAASGILLLWNKKFIGSIIFGAGALLTSALYFYDFSGKESIDMWVYQFFSSPSLDSLKSTPVLLKPFINLLSEHMRYFHNLEISVFSIFLFLAAIIGFQYLYKKQTNLVRFTLLAALFTGLLTMHKSRQYIIPFFPYILILITLTYKAIKQNQITYFPFYKKIKLQLFQGIFIFFFVIFIAVSAYFNSVLAFQKFSPNDNRELALKYAGDSISEMKIIAPITFIFNEIEHFGRIHGELFYTEMAKVDSGFYGEGFFQKAASYDISLIMVSSYSANKLGILDFKVGEIHGNYLETDKNEDLVVFKRIPEKQPEKAIE